MPETNLSMDARMMAASWSRSRRDIQEECRAGVLIHLARTSQNRTNSAGFGADRARYA
jgi:hypothetical protein